MGWDEALQTGDRVGDYEVVREIGRGGFGRVYEVVHGALGKRAAAKVLNAERAARPEVIQRFLQEARAGAKLEHPGIVEVFAYGRLDDGRPYFVMELLDGRSLAGLLDERGRLDLAEALPILRDVAAALDAAHAHGIAHRDLKPANVFLEHSGRARLLDFGVAKLLDEGRANTTDDALIVGTPHYMSPEQSRGRPIDTRADLYALGVLSFRMLTGEHPFDGEDAVGVLVQHAAHPPPKPSAVFPSLPSEVDRAVLAMLEKDPAKRPASAKSAIEALAGPPRVGLGRRRWLALGVVLIAIGLGLLVRGRPIAGAAITMQPPSAPPEVSTRRPETEAPAALPPPSSAPTASSKPAPRRAPRTPDPEGIEDPFQR